MCRVTADSKIAKDLGKLIEGDVLFDELSRQEYATAACIFKVRPLGAVCHKTTYQGYKTDRPMTGTVSDAFNAPRISVLTPGPDRKLHSLMHWAITGVTDGVRLGVDVGPPKSVAVAVGNCTIAGVGVAAPCALATCD